MSEINGYTWIRGRVCLVWISSEQDREVSALVVLSSGLAWL